MNNLSPAHEFKTNGYTIIRNVIPVDEVLNYRVLFEDMQRKHDCGRSISKDEIMLTYFFDEVIDLQEYIFSGKVRKVLNDILGESVWCLPESLLHCNRYFDWHKDSTVMDIHAMDYPLHNGSTIVQLGLYFQDNSESGGGLLLTEGSHRTPDRFALAGNTNVLKRILKHALGNSLNKQIERSESTLVLDNRAGDVVLFDYRVDHRASFKRNAWGKPRRLTTPKYAVFSQFSNDQKLLLCYLEAISRNPGPYADFLKNYKLPAPLKLLLKGQSLNSVIE